MILPRGGAVPLGGEDDAAMETEGVSAGIAGIGRVDACVCDGRERHRERERSGTAVTQLFQAVPVSLELA